MPAPRALSRENMSCPTYARLHTSRPRHRRTSRTSLLELDGRNSSGGEDRGNRETPGCRQKMSQLTDESRFPAPSEVVAKKAALMGQFADRAAGRSHHVSC